MSTNHPDTRDDLISYCKRKLGEPVLEVNVALEQVEDRIDDALEYYQEFHSDATIRTYLKHLVTESDVTNGYIPISSDVIFVQRLFPVNSASGVNDWSGIKYQIMLNDVGNLGNFMSELVYYEQMQQHMSLLDMKINGTPQVSFSRRQNRLVIHGEFGAGDIKAGDYIIAQVVQIINPETHTSIYNDMWLKEYATALIKRQWGANLIKFEGMQLPGGVILNGRQIYEDATVDIEKLEERIRLEQELPVDFFVG